MRDNQINICKPLAGPGRRREALSDHGHRMLFVEEPLERVPGPSMDRSRRATALVVGMLSHVEDLQAVDIKASNAVQYGSRLSALRSSSIERIKAAASFEKKNGSRVPHPFLYFLAHLRTRFAE